MNSVIEMFTTLLKDSRRKFDFFILCAQHLVVAILLVSCTSLPPTDEQVYELISAIPDHGIKEGSEKYFTAEYDSLLKHAWAIPSDAIGEIGSDEWLYYFITGNDMPDSVPSPEITKISTNKDKAFVMFRFLDTNHRMDLVINDRKWVIADYDSTLSKLAEYIDRQREYFRSENWKEYLDNTRKEYSAEDADKAEKEVTEYFLKYR